MMHILIRFISLIALVSLPLVQIAHAAPSKDGGQVEQIDPVARKISGSDDYVPFFGIRSSVTEGFSVAGYIAVDAGLHIEKSKIRKHVASIRPRILDAMRMAVANYANGPHNVGEVPNLDVLRARMQRAVDKQLGKGASRVVLASVMMFDAD